MEDRLEREEQIAAMPPKQPLAEIGDIVAEEQFEPELRALIERCMDGTEPKERPLGNNEPDQFSPANVTVILMLAAGFRNKDVCSMLGYTPTYVSVIKHHPYGRKLLHALMHRQSGRVLDIRTRMEAYAGDILDKVYKDAMFSDDLKVVSSIGFDLLDRTGYAPQQNISVKSQSVNVTATTDPTTLSRIASALEESNRVDQFIMPTRPPVVAPGEERSVGTSESTPARDADSQPRESVGPRPGALGDA